MLEVSPISGAFAAQINHVDLANLTDAEFETIYAAWVDHGVLRIRAQMLDEAGLQQFSARFGPLEEAPTGRMSAAQKAKIKNRYVTQLSNILVNGKPIAFCWA